MIIKAGIKEFLWMVAGAIIFLVIALVVLHFQPGQVQAEQTALKAKRADIAGRMRMTLTIASEAEKSAVMAVTDQDSKAFADQARAATDKVERDRAELGQLIAAGGTREEKDIFSQFSRSFIDLQHIDNELLKIAVKNTNIKAYSLAFGPAADALKEMDISLSKLVEKNAGSNESNNAAFLVFEAQTAALRIQALLAPHIAEENEKKMDDLEVLMAKYDKEVRKDLAGLAILLKPGKDIDLGKAVSEYEKISNIRVRILALSRENTNVRSLGMSLGEKRKVLLLCQDELSTLQLAIQSEHIVGINYETESNPRSLLGGKQ